MGALTSLDDRAVSPMSLISRAPRRPCMTWLMNAAVSSRPHVAVEGPLGEVAVDVDFGVEVCPGG